MTGRQDARPGNVMMLKTAHQVTGAATVHADHGRLAFVDGLRGIAAVVVMSGHAIAMAHPETDPIRSHPQYLMLRPLQFGGQMVLLFILISGFALCWSEDDRVLSGQGRTSLSAYLRRRAWRILPTYYVALGLGLVVVVLLNELLLTPASPSIRSYQPVTWMGTMAHLPLLHTLNPAWAHEANPPLWTIAFEAQLYILFPIALALITRRMPAFLACAACMIGAKTVSYLTHLPLFGLMEWFFAGVMAARLARREGLPHRLLLAVGIAGTSFGVLCVSPYSNGRLTQALWMISFFCLVTGLVRARPGRWNLPTLRPVVWLGHRSYSLYAIHFPVLLLVWAAVGRLQLPSSAALAVMLLVGASASVACAHLLYVSVERPALARMRRVGRHQQTRTKLQQ